MEYDTEERTRIRAYHLWQERGCPFGTPEVDWFKAERYIHAQQDGPDSGTTIVTLAKTIGSVLGSVAGLVSTVTAGAPTERGGKQ